MSSSNGVATATLSADERATEILDTIENLEHELDQLDGEEYDEENADSTQAVVHTEPPAKLTKTQKDANAKEKKRQAALDLMQSQVPWVVLRDQYAYNQQSNIDQWADDSGQFPERYRSYTREEWHQAISTLAAAVEGLNDSDPAYQRLTGLYVEEHTPDLLLIRAKLWQLQIEVPSKSTIKGKRFTLIAGDGKDDWSGKDKRPDAFADLLANHVPAADRETLLNICCQYIRDVRIRVNKAMWAQANPKLAHLVKYQR